MNWIGLLEGISVMVGSAVAIGVLKSKTQKTLKKTSMKTESPYKLLNQRVKY